MQAIRLTLEKPVASDCEVIIGLPIDTPEQRLVGGEVRGAPWTREIVATNSGQSALLIPVSAGGALDVVFEFEDGPSSFPDWTFEPTGGPHERPSLELVKLIRDIAPPMLDLAQRVERIVRHVEERFTYGLRDVGLGDDADAMPALACDTHLGTCIDTHSYAVAAMRAAGIDAAYISGIFFPEGESVTMPGHCWFVVDANGAPHHWDISHFLKYGLGPVRPIYNPKPGTRYALSVGRDLTFEGRDGQSFARGCPASMFCRGLRGEQSSKRGPNCSWLSPLRLNPDRCHKDFKRRPYRGANRATGILMSLKIAIVTDIHHGQDAEAKKGSQALPLLKKFARFVAKEKPDLVIDLGDRISDEDPATDLRLEEDVSAAFEPIRRVAPVFHICGNHDRDFLSVYQNERIPRAIARQHHARPRRLAHRAFQGRYPAPPARWFLLPADRPRLAGAHDRRC